MMQVLQFALQQNQQGQQQENQDRSFGLDQQKLDMGVQQFNQQTLQQQEQRKQQQQQAVMAALSRAMPQTANGFDDPTVLYQYLQQQGIQLPGMQPQQQVVDPQKAAAQAMMQKLGQQ